MAIRRRKTRAATRRRWTVLVYLAGDNNLDSAGAVDLDEMKRVGSTDDVNVVAQFDRSGRKARTVRYYLRKGTTRAQDVVQSLGETNTGDPAVLEAFLNWGMRDLSRRALPRRALEPRLRLGRFEHLRGRLFQRGVAAGRAQGRGRRWRLDKASSGPAVRRPCRGPTQSASTVSHDARDAPPRRAALRSTTRRRIFSTTPR